MSQIYIPIVFLFSGKRAIEEDRITRDVWHLNDLQDTRPFISWGFGDSCVFAFPSSHFLSYRDGHCVESSSIIWKEEKLRPCPISPTSLLLYPDPPSKRKQYITSPVHYMQLFGRWLYIYICIHVNIILMMPSSVFVFDMSWLIGKKKSGYTMLLFCSLINQGDYYIRIVPKKFEKSFFFLPRKRTVWNV
jgi:hypothetical protein